MSRRLLSAVTALVVVLVGLIALQPQAAQAAANPFLTITPNPAVANTLTTFTVVLEGGSSNNVAAANIALPASFTSISGGTITPQASVNSWTINYNSGTKTFLLTAGDQNQKRGAGETITFTFQAMTGANGAASFGLSTWANAGRNGPAFTTTGSVSVGQTAQTITFDPLGDKTFGDAPFTVAATGGGSGNPVTFSATGDCTSTGTNGSTITLTGAGSCSVTANQAGGSGYTAAAPVTRSFSIAKANQTITLAPIATQTFGGPAVDVTANASSGLGVSLSVTGNCSLAGTSITLTGAGQCTVYADQAGNANFNAAAQQSVTFTINKASAVLTLDDLGPYTYDGDPHAASVSTTPSGLSGTSVTYDGSSTAPTDAGSYTVVATLDNADYAAESVTGTLVISPRHVTGAFTAAGKTYDGNTDAVITDCSVTDPVSGDDVDLDCSAATATFASKDAGTHTVSLTGAVLSGADADNYVLDGVADTSATIDAKSVTGAIQASDKNYDGTTAASATGLPLDGAVGSDDVTVNVVSASFADKNVGVDKTVTATIELVGADAGNYVLTSTTATDEATIWAKLLTGSFTADDKVYDGTAAATAHAAPLSGVVGTEDVSLSVSNAQFADENVGTDKTVTADLALTGADAGNYALTASTGTAQADITAKPVTGSFTAADKLWDGTTAATITGRSLSGAISGDDVQLAGGTATFDTAAVGTGKTVTATGFILTGTDAGNYALVAGPWTTTASITALYRGTGFYQPVDMTPANGTRVYNTIKGGQTVPLKFDIYNTQTGAEQTSLSIFGPDAAAQAAAFKINKINCTTTSTPDDAIEIVTTGATQLRYDGTAPTGQFIQNWKTPTTVGTCYSVSVVTIDGSSVGPAYFKITK